MTDDKDLPKLPKPFSYDRDLTDIYRWLPLQCNDQQLGILIDQIQSTSKFAKKEILKGGPIDHKVRSLRKAVGYGLIKQETLVRLLRDCEESGQQWIYLYRADEKFLGVLSNPDAIRKSLFPAVEFPRFQWPNDGLVWADFRVEADTKDWVIKVYEHARVKKVVDSKDGERIDNDLYQDWTKYTYQDAYLVHVVRWTNSLSRLEVRIDKEKSLGRKSARQGRFNAVIDKILPAIPISSLKAWSLETACTKMLKRRSDQASQYRFGHIRLQNGDRGKCNLFPVDSQSSLDQDKGREVAVNEIIRNGGKILEGCVNFKVPSGMEKPKPLKEDVDSEVAKDDELRTIIGGDRWNEVSISSRISPKLLDHVLKNLCKTYA